MSLFKLALQNFKASFKSYLSLIISLSFTTIILSNFINLIDSGILDALGESQSSNIEAVIQVLAIVIAAFMIFFVWYSTNVFLTKRKKEMGIYIFMGLTNQRIGQLYMIETSLIGFVTLVLGISIGMVTSQLFTMILLKLSAVAIPIEFHFTLSSIFKTSIIFSIIYIIFVFKGYINMIRSSVLDMVSANKHHEKVKQNTALLLFKAMGGIGLLGFGFYYANKDGGIEVFGNIVLATISVIIGIYLIFGGLIPVVFQSLAKHKQFLYKKERTLWINHMIFGMKRNYRTYAMVCVLMLCSVTALAFGFAMKERTDQINHFEKTYTYQILSDGKGHRQDFNNIIQKYSDIKYASEVEIAMIPNELTDSPYEGMPYAIVSYTQIKDIANDIGFDFNLKQPKDNEFIELDKLYLMSFVDDKKVKINHIDGCDYTSIQETTSPYLGYMQEQMDYMIVSDATYDQLKPLSQSMYLYNFKIEDFTSFEKITQELQNSPYVQGLVKMDPNNNENAWIQIIFSVSCFTFMVFILASGSILFMKIYNDAFEEKERYLILQKMGIDTHTLKKAISIELKVAYALPLCLMTIASFFSIQALANVMYTPSLLSINLLSLAIIYVFFMICFWCSKYLYITNVGLK